jgi:hypothetical protein
MGVARSLSTAGDPSSAFDVYLRRYEKDIPSPMPNIGIPRVFYPRSIAELITVLICSP